MMARGYLTNEQHKEFGRHLPTSNMGHCMGELADALDEIEELRVRLKAIPVEEIKKMYGHFTDCANDYCNADENAIDQWITLTKGTE